MFSGELTLLTTCFLACSLVVLQLEAGCCLPLPPCLVLPPECEGLTLLLVGPACGLVVLQLEAGCCLTLPPCLVLPPEGEDLTLLLIPAVVGSLRVGFFPPSLDRLQVDAACGRLTAAALAAALAAAARAELEAASGTRPESTFDCEQKNE